MNKKIVTTAAALAAAAGMALGVTSMAAADPSATPVASASAQPGSGTQVTGAELAALDDAINSRAHIVTITSATKNPDGTYHVVGTLAGTPVDYQVSADLNEITDLSRPYSDEDPSQVSDQELAAIDAAINSKAPAFIITSAVKDGDGTYYVQATQGGTDVEFHLAADLTILSQA